MGIEQKKALIATEIEKDFQYRENNAFNKSMSNHSRHE